MDPKEQGSGQAPAKIRFIGPCLAGLSEDEIESEFEALADEMLRLLLGSKPSSDQG